MGLVHLHVPGSYFKPTFPQSDTAIIAGSGQNGSSDIPLHPPDLHSLVIQLSRCTHFQLRVTMRVRAGGQRKQTHIFDNQRGNDWQMVPTHLEQSE